MRLRPILALFAVVFLAACSAKTPEPVPAVAPPIGDFRLGFNIVVANDVKKGPSSRDATEDELSAAVRATMEERLGRYDGDGLYHIGLRIEAYALGRAGVPILYSPRSILVIAMNVFDDATQEKLTEEPIRITAFESQTGVLAGTGLVSNREEQLAALAFDAALKVEQQLIENAELWFAPKEGRERIEFTRDPETGRQLVVSEDDLEGTSEAGSALDAPQTPVIDN